MMECRAGFDSFAAAQAGMADELRMIRPSQPSSGRILEESGIWVPPSESLASRTPPLKSKGHCCGSIVDHDANRKLKTESDLERRFAAIVMAHRGIVRLVEQPPAVTYRTLDGVEHKHTFDFLAHTAKGARIAFAVKPEKRREKSGIDTIVSLIEQQVGARFADRYMVVSEQDVTPTRVHNAELILLCRKRRNDEDVVLVRGVVATIHGAVRLADLVTRSRIGARGFNAAVCLLDDGTLQLARPGQRIDYLAEVLRPTVH
jgi:hypothetical protein